MVLPVAVVSPLSMLWIDFDWYCYRHYSDEQQLLSGKINGDESSKQLNKNVRFIEQPQVYETLSSDSLTAEEKSAMWYDAQFFFENETIDSGNSPFNVRWKTYHA